MTDSTKTFESRLVELTEKKEALKEQMKTVSEELEAVMMSLGMGHAFQAENGLVYKIVEPMGAFTYFKKIDYVRTKKENEVKGSLAKTEAKALGFNVG